ncbi:MAG: CAP domain-containing protein [Butyricicoccus sp.]
MKRLVSFSVAAMMAMGMTAGAVNQNPQVMYYTLSSNASCAGNDLLCSQLLDKLCTMKPGCGNTGTENGTPSIPENGGSSDGGSDSVENSTPSAPDAGSDAAGDTQEAFAAQVVSLVNAERAKNGLPALEIDSRVTAAAQTRAGELKRSFSHSRPDGRSCFTALTESGASYRGAGENIAYGQTTPEAVMNAWMNSDGHRANILSNKYTTIGVGYTVIDGVPYWAQMFTY